MTVDKATISDFEQSWNNNPEHRYSYELNKGAMILFSLLLGGFWSYWAITTIANGFDMVLTVLGSLFILVTLYVLFMVLKWRHYGRLSGAICEDSRLVWRTSNNVFVAPWSVLDLDGIGLLKVDMSQNKYEHSLSIHGHPLYLFRPFVKMRHYEVFIGDVLLRLKAHGRIESQTKQKKKKKVNR
ncbi:MAG TPA: hypothetical protein EYN66_23855 [Myxococcales bacterium]|nr:hypothetical protein [Myxococcales bacterium]